MNLVQILNTIPFINKTKKDYKYINTDTDDLYFLANALTDVSPDLIKNKRFKWIGARLTKEEFEKITGLEFEYVRTFTKIPLTKAQSNGFGYDSIHLPEIIVKKGDRIQKQYFDPYRGPVDKPYVIKEKGVRYWF